MTFRYKLQTKIISVTHGVPLSLQDEILTEDVIKLILAEIDEYIKNDLDKYAGADLSVIALKAMKEIFTRK